MRFSFFCITVLCLAYLPLGAQQVLYVYGDVSASGDVPSGDAPPFHQMRLNDTGNRGMSQFRDALTEAGLTVREAYDQDISLTADFLENLDVLVLASNQRRFTEEEAEAVRVWVDAGGGLVAWSDSAFGGHFREVGLANTAGRLSDNDITVQFGMYFLTDNGGGNYLIQRYTKPHFLNAFEPDGGVRFRGEGVSFVRVSSPATVLAVAQESGLGGRLAVNQIDAPFNAETDAALAIAEVGTGRVVGVFDRNLFWNAGEGTRLSHSNNREFTQRLMLWAAGVEDADRIPERASTVAGVNRPAQVEMTHTFSSDGKTLVITARIQDADTDDIVPEITWQQVRGPADGIFENNNRNTATPRIQLPAAGTYRFRAIITDGEYRLVRMVQVERK